MTDNKPSVASGFDDLGIKDTILEQIKKMGFLEPTPIQAKTIPVGLTGQDVIGVAQTGTGKTFAFGIPLMQRIGVMGGRGLVLLPTRELALQVEDSFKKLGTSLGLKTASFIGGEAMERQLFALRKNPHVIIATPGRLTDYIKRKFLNLNDINVLVLDEADMMLDMGFAPQVEEILSYIKHDHQTMLFSATMPTAIVKLAAKHMKMPVSIEAAPPGTTAEKVDQEIYIMHKDDRVKHLLKILEDYKGQVLIFVRTKYGVKGLVEHLNGLGHKAEEIHSNLSLSQRRRSLSNFKTGHSRILVATDIAARGLDVSGIELVVNYHLPDKLSDYVHRIGRTARAGKTGKAISFATPDQARDIRDIEALISQTIPLNKFVELEQRGPRTINSQRSNRGSRAPRRDFRGGGDRFSRPKTNVEVAPRRDKPGVVIDKNFDARESFSARPAKPFNRRVDSFKKRDNRDNKLDSFKKPFSRNEGPKKFSGKSDFNFIEELPVSRKSSSKFMEARPSNRFADSKTVSAGSVRSYKTADNKSDHTRPASRSFTKRSGNPRGAARSVK
jgi:ATP-dependent RNA helicase RhlE